MANQAEPFINADEAAEFLRMKRLRIMRLAKAGRIPAHPFPRGRGNDWFFLKSELHGFITSGGKLEPRPFVVGKAQ